MSAPTASAVIFPRARRTSARTKSARSSGRSFSQRATCAPALRSASASALFRAPPACRTTTVMPSPGRDGVVEHRRGGVLPRLVGAVAARRRAPRRTATGSARRPGPPGWPRGPGMRRTSTSGSATRAASTTARTARSTSSSSSPSTRCSGAGADWVDIVSHRRARPRRDVTRLPDRLRRPPATGSGGARAVTSWSSGCPSAPPDHNRIWLIQRGRGNGPLKPRQPASRDHRAQTITVPIPTRARGEDEEIFR